jgi:hypothetical protein
VFGLTWGTLLLGAATLGLGVFIHWYARGWPEASEEFAIFVMYSVAPTVVLIVAIFLWNFLWYGPYSLHAELRAKLASASPLQFETFSRTDTSGCIYIVGARVTNVTNNRLNHCTVTIENIQGSNPQALFNIFSNSKLKRPAAKEEEFGLNPRTPKEIPIAQFDSINGRFENLGLELLSVSAQGYEALDPEQSYSLTLRASAEVGPPLRKRYQLSLDCLGRPCLEPLR